MKFTTSLFVLGAVLAALSVGCGEEKAAPKKVEVQEVQGYKPNLPSVPTIPKPSVPETYPDGTHSVYGLRKGIVKNIETQVTLTAYIAQIYQKPECPEGKTCHVLMPHLFLADDKDEKLDRRLMRLVGYAKSFKEMEEEQEKDEKGIEDKPLPEGVYLPPVVWDWRLGQKYKITGRFTRRSAEGFMATDGLMDYVSHECLDCPPEEDTKKK